MTDGVKWGSAIEPESPFEQIAPRRSAGVTAIGIISVILGVIGVGFSLLGVVWLSSFSRMPFSTTPFALAIAFGALDSIAYIVAGIGLVKREAHLYALYRALLAISVALIALSFVYSLISTAIGFSRLGAIGSAAGFTVAGFFVSLVVVAVEAAIPIALWFYLGTESVRDEFGLKARTSIV